MVTTIGIDPHKATHTAVAIDESEIVLSEITIAADRYQMSRLMGWADNVNGHSSRVWAVEAAGGLGYLLSQQLVARGEHVVDVPAVLASRVRLQTGAPCSGCRMVAGFRALSCRTVLSGC